MVVEIIIDKEQIESLQDERGAYQGDVFEKVVVPEDQKTPNPLK